ncbi:unnamed protein product [Allacma fusca]|uniref:Uncharacterized protein n=1 Tax=Allacma fusca TaxID=39272 RepID=A0A8J2NXK1_9HEXA|nr:unnamed protein product [Allacma fusca]
MEFAVVHFSETNEVEAVPTKWFTEDSDWCYWPNFRNTTKITAAIKSCVTHSGDWKKHLVNIKGYYATLEKARAGARKAEVMSDIGSESENPSKRTRKIFRPEGKLNICIYS